MTTITMHEDLGFSLDILDASNLLFGDYYVGTKTTYTIYYSDGQRDEFRGKGFDYVSPSDPTPVAGTITRYTAFLGDARLIEISGLSLSAVSLAKAATTARTSDDRALFVAEFSGADTFNGSDLRDVVDGYGGDDKLYGRGGNDVLKGGAGADTLNGGSGSDKMSGGKGNDLYIVDSTRDVTTEERKHGTDKVHSSVTYSLAANIENLKLTGSRSIDGTGNALANVIVGNSGSNVINGSDGNDTLTGGAGRDTFSFKAPLSSSKNRDVITDFDVAADTIELENAIFRKLPAGTLDPEHFRIGSAALDANDFLIYNRKTGALIYDSNGDRSGGSMQFATLSTKLQLTDDDFFVV